MYFPLFASALIKMSQVTHCCFSHPFEDLSRRNVLHVNTKSFYWDYLDHRKVKYGKWNKCPPPNTKNLYLLADLGIWGAGHAWVACSKSGSVCVLKFSSAHMRRLRVGVVQKLSVIGGTRFTRSGSRRCELVHFVGDRH